ncbi:MAG TPA: tetratricopeptide repeat protein [Blastocatellia bacterium]|nr:tetratricopeptide repeat protein [Blastocatellia bacterium]
MKVKSNVRCLVMAISVIALHAYGVQAQDQPPPVSRIPIPRTDTALGSITGRVVLPSGHPVNDRVRISLSTLNDPGMIVYTDTNGAFGFSGLRNGTYSIEVSGDGKLYDPVTEQVTLLRGMRATLVIHLRERGNSSNKKAGGVVSVAELDVGVPASAKKEYEKGSKLSMEGKTKEAIAQFHRALEIHPTYLKARNDLGVQYIILKQWEEAIEQFDAAIDINPKSFNPRLNMGIALVELRRYVEAMDHLNMAVAIDSSSPAAHLYLGIAALQTEDLSAAEGQLSTALSIGGPEHAIAHFYLANVHLKKGDRDRAIIELKTYLQKAPEGDKASQARKLLDDLKN